MADYDISKEEEPLGSDGAIRQAIETLSIDGRVMMVPGDAMLPWKGLADMANFHAQNGDGITVAATSHVTPRTTDIGKLVVEDDTNRLLWCYSRDEQDLSGGHTGSKALTSAAAIIATAAEYVDIVDSYKAEQLGFIPPQIGFRDQIAPWLIKDGTTAIHAFDVRGEVLDLGTPSNINYGIEHWQDYA